jgi:PAS domain S-box-containing protein
VLFKFDVKKRKRTKRDLGWALEQIDPRHEKNLKRLSKIFGYAIFLFGFLTLWFWAGGKWDLLRWGTGYPFIAPLTSLMFCVLGIYLLWTPSTNTRSAYYNALYGTVFLLLGAAALFLFLEGLPPLLGQVFPAPSGRVIPVPGPNTTLCISLIGVAVLLSNRYFQMSQWILTLSQFIPISSLLGHAFRFNNLHIPLSDPPYLGMTLPTALAFFAAFIGLLARNPGRGILWRLGDRSASGEVLRKIGLACLLVPILFGFTAVISANIQPRNASFAYMGLVLLVVAIFLSAAVFVIRALDQTEEKFRSLVENSHDSILLVDEKGKIEFANQQVTYLLGYRFDELSGKTVDCIIPDRFVFEHAVERQRHFSSPHARPADSGLELLARAKDGREIPVEISLTPLQIGDHQIVTAVMRDVSGRKRLERRQKFLSESARILSESMDYQDRLQKIAEQSVPFLADFCLVYVAEDGRPRLGALSHRQKSMEPLLKETSEKYPPTGFSHIGSEAEDAKTDLYSVISDTTFRQRAVNADHLERLRNLKLSSFLSVPLVARSKVIGLLALGMVDSSRHFTEQDKEFIELAAHRFAMAADNARLYHEAQIAAQNREDILSVVSHDLKTPLAAIDLSAQILAKRAGVDLNADYVRELSRRIQRSTGHMQRLVQSLLAYGKLQSGNFTIKPSAMKVKDLFRELDEMFSPLAKGKEIALSFNCAEDLSAQGDSQALFQALSNLIGNSLKFTPAQGSIEVKGASENEGVALSVRDSGSGMPADLQEKIFARYWQPETSKNMGSGLGLFIVKGIVGAHKGRVEVESKLGHGSCFTIHLPSAGQPLQAAPSLRHTASGENLFAAAP